MTLRMISIVAALTTATATVASAQPSQTGSDWPSYNRTPTGERFAPQTEITPANAASLRQVCSYDTGLRTSFQTGPIVVGRTMYFTSHDETFAIDAATCRELWRTKLDAPTKNPLVVNRGLAFLDGRLFRGQQDGGFVAIDARTGRTIWKRMVGIDSKGESIPGAPIAHDGRVFVGVAGGDHKGVRGRVYAFDARTGAPLWETYLVPRGTPVAGVADSIVTAPIVNDATAGLNPGWGNVAPITGGATWTALTLDRQRGLLYVPAGNAAPDFLADQRPGDNLLANSFVALDVRTGAYVRHWATSPGDFHDWDVSSAPALITTRGGRAIVTGGTKDGHLYAFAEGTAAPLFRTPVTSVLNATTPLTATGTYFCPGALGGVQWNGPAYSPTTNLLYVNSVDWCTTVRITNASRANNVAIGQNWTGSADEEGIFGIQDSRVQGRGWLNAVDADTGRVVWTWRGPAPMVAAVTATAGGVVYTGDLTGRLHAFGAADGKALGSWVVGGPIAGGVISYEIDRRQLIAVAAGTESPVFAPWKGGPARITIMALPSR